MIAKPCLYQLRNRDYMKLVYTFQGDQMGNNEQEIQKAINLKCNQLRELLTEKNKMYGNSFFKTLDEYGNVLICVRIEDKLNRLKQIILNGEKDNETDERLIDTLMDLAGYAILSRVYIDNKSKST